MQYTTVQKNVNPLREGWCEFLDQYKWDWFTTLTFADRLIKTYTAINKAKHWLTYLEDMEKVNIGYYMCMELNRLNIPHFHLLMGNLGEARRLTWMDKWEDGYARILRYNPKLGAAHYLTKYVVKDNYQKGYYDIQGLHLLREVNKCTSANSAVNRQKKDIW